MAMHQHLTHHCRVLTITQVLEQLVKHGKISDDMSEKVQAFVRENQVQLPAVPSVIEPKTIAVPIRQRLTMIIEKKRTNLCLSADLTSLDEIIVVGSFSARHFLSDRSINMILVSRTNRIDDLHAEDPL